MTRIHAVHLVDLVSEFLGADRRHSFEDIHTCAGFEPKASGGSVWFVCILLPRKILVQDAARNLAWRIV